jgi:CBS-domain-containing membrane protein
MTMAWTVSDVMTKEVVTVRPDDDFKACMDLLRIHTISALPVVNDADELLGIVSEADLLRKEERQGSRGNKDRKARARVAAEMMSSPAWSVGPGASLAEAARLLHAKKVKRLPVVDPGGRLVGIVSRVDLLKPYLRSDESIRREIAEQLLEKTLFIDRRTVEVEVNRGIVRLQGELETKSLAGLVVKLAEGVEGVVAVDSKLTYRLDDTHLTVDTPPLAFHLSAQERK